MLSLTDGSLGKRCPSVAFGSHTSQLHHIADSTLCRRLHLAPILEYSLASVPVPSRAESWRTQAFMGEKPAEERGRLLSEPRMPRLELHSPLDGDSWEQVAWGQRPGRPFSRGPRAACPGPRGGPGFFVPSLSFFLNSKISRILKHLLSVPEKNCWGLS